MKLKLILISLIFLNLGCKEDILIGDQTIDVIEAGISSMNDIPDDVSNENLASNQNYLKKSPWIKLLESVQILKAHAADCTGRAGGLTCSAGEKNYNYLNCTIPSTNQVLNGSVSLMYSDTANCTLDTNGESVTRRYDYTRTTSWGAVVTTTDDNKVDYTGGAPYGGGGILTNVSGNFILEIDGKHKTRTTAGGRSALDLSIRTTSPITMSSLSRISRSINGGRLEIAHNIRKFTVALVPSNLNFDTTCCYPTSGSISVAISGSINATGLVEFNGCGNATLAKNGVTKNIGLYSCE